MLIKILRPVATKLLLRLERESTRNAAKLPDFSVTHILKQSRRISTARPRDMLGNHNHPHNTTPGGDSMADTLSGLGAILIAMQLMPFIGDSEYLHVSSVNRTMRAGYAGFTNTRVTASLTIFTSLSQFKLNICYGYNVYNAMNTAARLGRLDVMRYLHGIGVAVSNTVCVLLAKHGRLHALKWGLRTGAIPADMLTVKVNQAALRSNYLNVFRWCIDQKAVVKVSDLEKSVVLGGEWHVDWALRKFPQMRSIVAAAIGISDMPNALDLYKKVDRTRDSDGRGHFYNFMSVLRGGNVDILSHIVSKIRSAKIDIETGRDWMVELGFRLRFMDDNRGQHDAEWFDERGMDWAKNHVYLSRYFV